MHWSKFYGWLVQSDAETSSQVSFGRKTAQVKSLAMFWSESRVGKRFRALNMLKHCSADFLADLQLSHVSGLSKGGETILCFEHAKKGAILEFYGFLPKTHRMIL